MKALYGNVGKKLMILAQVMGVLFIVGGVIAFLCLMGEQMDTALPLLAGCVMASISTWTLYGFGKLIDDVGALRQQKEQPNPTEKA